MKKLPAPSAPEPGFILRDAPADVPDLELPDAPDFVSRRTPLSLDQMLPLLEERRRLFPITPAMRELRMRRRVTAEFVL